MSLPDCEFGGELAYELCPGRDIGYHDPMCIHWDIKPVDKFIRIPGVLYPLPDHESAYEVCLTSPEDNPYYLRETLQKIVASAIYDVVYWEASMELTEAGMPHIHALILSKKKYLDGTKVKAPKGPFKFKHRYSFKRVRKMVNYINYIKKENRNPIIIDYCVKKGIPQFWDSKNGDEKKENDPQATPDEKEDLQKVV